MILDVKSMTLSEELRALVFQEPSHLLLCWWIIDLNLDVLLRENDIVLAYNKWFTIRAPKNNGIRIDIPYLKLFVVLETVSDKLKTIIHLYLNSQYLITCRHLIYMLALLVLRHQLEPNRFYVSFVAFLSQISFEIKHLNLRLVVEEDPAVVE